MPLSLQQLGPLQHASLPAGGGYVQDSPYRAPPCVVFCPPARYSAWGFQACLSLSLSLFLLSLSVNLAFLVSMRLLHEVPGGACFGITLAASTSLDINEPSTRTYL